MIINDDSIVSCIDLSNRYILNKQLPDKAIDLLDEACARISTLSEKLKNNDDFVKLEKDLESLQLKLEQAIASQDYFKAAEFKEKEDNIKQQMNLLRNQNNLPKHLRPIVDVNEITTVLADKLGIPSNQISKSEIDKLRNLDKELKEYIM